MDAAPLIIGTDVPLMSIFHEYETSQQVCAIARAVALLLAIHDSAELVLSVRHLFGSVFFVRTKKINSAVRPRTDLKYKHHEVIHYKNYISALQNGSFWWAVPTLQSRHRTSDSS